MILRVVDLPDPLAPRMIFVWPLMSVKLQSFSTTFSAQASMTWLNTMTGAPLSLSICFAVRPDVTTAIRSVEELDEDLRHEEVGRDDGNRPRNHRQRRRAPDAGGAARRAHSDVARDRDDEEAEHKGLRQPHPRI